MKQADGRDESGFLGDVLREEDDLRARSLEQGLVALRGARRRRRLLRGAGTIVSVAILLLSGLWARRKLSASKQLQLASYNAPEAADPISKMMKGVVIQTIGDEELLAAFKGRPVALIGESGKQRLVFLDKE